MELLHTKRKRNRRSSSKETDSSSSSSQCGAECEQERQSTAKPERELNTKSKHTSMHSHTQSHLLHTESTKTHRVEIHRILNGAHFARANRTKLSHSFFIVCRFVFIPNLNYLFSAVLLSCICILWCGKCELTIYSFTPTLGIFVPTWTEKQKQRRKKTHTIEIQRKWEQRWRRRKKSSKHVTFFARIQDEENVKMQWNRCKKPCLKRKHKMLSELPFQSAAIFSNTSTTELPYWASCKS